MWGAGNFGQFGLGPDILQELEKPRKHTWVEQQIQAGTFGEVGAGLETIAGGGMHTLFIDEKGTVSSIAFIYFACTEDFCRFGPAASTTLLHWGA